MKGTPVVRSKLIMPQLTSSFIMSERIKKLCKAMHNRSAVMITAPAGYGKTSLMVAALHTYGLDCRICWYRLEPEDSDLALFYAHFIEALFPAGEELWNDSRNTLADCGDIQSRHQYLNAVICQELWAFHNHHKKTKTFIVLDDFQLVKDSTEITSSIQYLINNLPDNCTFFISSRSETGLITAKQALEKNILKISREHLCFSEEEIKKLLIKIWGYKTNQKLIQKIKQNTEGWVAGIMMTGQVLSKCGAREIDAVFEKPGEKDLLYQYITLEVLKTVDHRLMLFLVKAAILDEFTAAEAGKILGVKKVSQILFQCEKQGMFIQRIIGEVTTYRFHELFRKVLLQIQSEYLSKAEIESYHLQAAFYYIESKIFNRAIKHFIASGNIPLAVELVTRESVNLVTLEAFEQLRLWFKLLPDDVVNNNAFLLFIKCYTYQKGEKEIVALAEKALSIFQENNDIDLQIKTLFLLNSFYQFRNDARNAAKTMGRARAAAKSAYDQPCEGICTVIDLVKAVWDEEYSGGIAACRDIDKLKLEEDYKWVALMYSCMLHLNLGELNTAGDFINEALEMDLVKRTELLKGFALVCYATVLHLKNERETFAAVITRIMDIGEKHDVAYMLGFGQRLAAFERYCKNDLETALELLESSASHFERLGNHAMRSLNILNRCLWLSRQQDPKELLAEAKAAYEVIATSQPGFCILQIGQSIMGALAREAGDFEFAEKALKASTQKSISKGAKQVLCGSLLHLAKFYYDTGDQVKGEDTLRQAFQIATDGGYVMFWDLHLPTLIEMSARCVKNNIHSEYAVELVAGYFGRAAAKFFKDNAVFSGDLDLQNFCNEFVSLFSVRDDDFLARVNICLLGKFSIAVNGAVISDNNWKTRKIEGILKYLILHRGKTITRESLMEIFWPGDKKSASMSLRAALYELRKVLARFEIPPDTLIQEKNGGLIVPASGTLFVDTDEFLSLYNELQKLPSSNSGSAQRLGILEKMVSLYKGNLLENDIYEDWTFFAREEFKSIYLEAAISLASIYIERGDNKKAEKVLLKTLSLDYYNEEACFCLLKLYIATNQRGRAVKLYTNFENCLKRDLNIKPDAKLASLIWEPGA